MSSLTKIFIVLQLVCSLVLAVMVVVLLSRQEPLGAKLDSEHVARIGVQAALAEKTNDLDASAQRLVDETAARTKDASDFNGKITALQGDLRSLRDDKAAVDAKVTQMTGMLQQNAAANQSLTEQLAAKDRELSRVGPENVSLIQKNAELGRALNEAQTAQRFSETAIRKLQEQLAAAEQKGGASAAPNDTSTVASLSDKAPAAQINAKITKVATTAGRTLLEVPLGTRDGIKVGTKFIVYRDQAYIASANVEKVTPDQSVAAVDGTSLKKGETVRDGDMVITGDTK